MGALGEQLNAEGMCFRIGSEREVNQLIVAEEWQEVIRDRMNRRCQRIAIGDDWMVNYLNSLNTLGAAKVTAPSDLLILILAT
jgi:hypothetical protein